MSLVEMIRVSPDGLEKTVSISHSHLNNMKAARELAGNLGELFDNDSTPSDTESRVNLDLKEIKRINSDGLNELIGINTQARNHGIQLVLIDVQEEVRKVFELTRLERMFEFASSPVTA
ncbi:MAG: STAS domain-containing protein [Rubripirellula sp.]